MMDRSPLPLTPRYGDLALTLFDFEDGYPPKRRPVVVISSNSFNAARQEVVVRAVSSDITRTAQGDCVLSSWQETGLLLPSRVTSWLKTLPRGALKGHIGSLGKADLRKLKASMQREILG